MLTSTIGANGQIIIPKAIRHRLGMCVGDRIDFTVCDDGTVVVEPAKRSVRALKGLLASKRQRSVSVATMHHAIRARG